MRYSKIENGVVTNIISADADFVAKFDGEYVEAAPEVAIGWGYDGTTFRDPNQPQTLDELRAKKLEDLKAYIDEHYKAYVSKYPEVEVQSFKDKAAEAALVKKDANTPLEDTPYLSALANNDVNARNALAAAVSAKVNKIAQLEALGSSLRDRIKAATTVEELEAITWGDS